MADDIITRDDNGDLAVNVVTSTEANVPYNYDDCFTLDINGRRALRVVGAGGSDVHNKGYFATEAALEEAYPTGEAGDYAIVGSTDTVWIWDEDNSEWVDTDTKGQVESVNGQTGQVNIKSVNGNSLMGSGDIELSTYLTYPNGWTTSGTTKAFCDDVAADTNATEGKAYLGEVTFSDLPASMANAEVRVEIIDGTTAQNKVIVLTCTSGNTAPYKWQYTYWNGGSDVSGWKTWATSEQGAKADTAVQPSDLATVATSGSYNDLSNKPTIPDAIQYSTMPVASADNLGDIVQFTGTTDANYTNGYFYRCGGNPASAIAEQTYGSGLSDISVTNLDTFDSMFESSFGVAIFGTVIEFEYDGSSWMVSTEIEGQSESVFDQDITDWAVSFTGTANEGDTIAVTYTEGDYYWEAISVQAGGGASGDYVEQVTSLPTASSTNVGKIVEYVGEDVPDIPESATITQTVGSGLTDLAVNVSTFVEEAQPEDGDVVDFVCSDSSRALTLVSGTDANISVLITDEDVFLQALDSLYGTVLGDGTEITVFAKGDGTELDPYEVGFGIVGRTEYYGLNPATYSITVTGYSDPNTYHRVIDPTYVLANYTWTKDNQSVNLADYGVSYSGVPSVNDELEVEYISEKEGKTKGYFYHCEPEYSEQSATISQTVGSSLSDLAVNLETFIEKEQPTGNETINFVASVINSLSETSGTNNGITVNIVNVDTFIGKAKDYMVSQGMSPDELEVITISAIQDDASSPIVIIVNMDNGRSSVDANPDNFAEWGLSVSGSAVEYNNYYTILQAQYTGSQAWLRNGVQDYPNEYGVSYSGSPENGDVLTVVYTASSLIGYQWKQIDVQPSSGSGGSSEIEWKTKIDLPSDYSGDIYRATPYYTIVGGLPDGEYEFYYSVQKIANSDFPKCEFIFKVKLIIDNQNTAGFGYLGYVFNGNFMNDEYAYGAMSQYMYNFIHKKSNDLILGTYGHDLWTSNCLGNNGRQTVPECFKLSAIKNIATGEEYIAEGSMDSIYPDLDYSGYMKLGLLAQTPTYNYFSHHEFNVVDVNNYAGLTIQPDKTFSAAYFRMVSGDDEFYGKIYRKGNGFEQEILIATGVFENCSFVEDLSSSNNPAVSWGNVVFTDSLTIDVGEWGGGQLSFYISWLSREASVQDCDYVKFGQTCKFVTPTYNQLGGIVQYIGETDVNYTKGYFYIALGTPVIVPASITTRNYDTSQWDVSVSNASGLLSALKASWGWSENDVKNAINNASWDIYYDADNDLITSMYCSYWGSISDSGILQYFSVVKKQGQTGYNYFSFNMTYVEESKSVQNARWERADVQPDVTTVLTSVTGYDATKTQVLKNVQGVFTWVDES